jgi:signal transduction histidine kinase
MVLASSCELLLENPALDQRARAQVERVGRACEEMRDLVQTFLMLARTQRDDASMTPRLMVGQAAEHLLSLWRKPIESKGLKLVVNTHEDVSQESYNATFLLAVMGNLLRNALHYTDEGFIALTLRSNGFLVEDSGVGIPEEKREAMFQPFVRGNEQRGEGLGLGLSLVQRICENQGWTVELSPMQPNGCRFSVVLKAD